MPDGQRLALRAEQDLLMGDQPGQPHRVHGDAVDVGAAGPSRPVLVASGLGGRSFRASAISRAVRAAVPDGASALCGWCSSMTSTDSKNRRGLLGEVHAQHGADGEVRRDQHGDVGLVGQPGSDLGERSSVKPVVPTTA